MEACRWDTAEKCVECGATETPGISVKFVCKARGVICLGCWINLPACHCGLEDFEAAKAVADQAARESA
jgi:hypothetical protein